MAEAWFDALTKAWGRINRRHAVLALAAMGSAAATEAAEAKRKRCRGDRVRCGSRCRNLQTNWRHCGRCGRACAEHELCRQGRCCRQSAVDCGGSCGGDCDRSARRPFPQRGRVAYPGAINWVGRSIEAQNAAVIAAWERWKAVYLVRERGDLAWVRHRKPGTKQAQETVSEGMGYGMILAAHLAGHDPEARAIFDGLWRFARAHPSCVDRRLMRWQVPETRASGCDSAFDGDVDMAYALLLADAQWGSDGVIHYRSAYDELIVGIAESTIGPQSRRPLLGDWVRPNDPSKFDQWVARTSDFTIGHFRAFGRLGDAAMWTAVVDACQTAIDHVQTIYSPRTGLLPDFVEGASAVDHRPRPVSPNFLEGPHDGDYGYNAGRVPWRLGADALLNGDPTAARQVLAMSRWARRATGGDPQQLRAGYRLDGSTWTGSNYVSTFFIAPFGVAAMVDPDGGTWLNAIYDAVRASRDDYYEDTVSLLCLLVMTGNFWDPTR